MFISYTAAVILLSLAMYGLWQLVRDLAEYLFGGSQSGPLSVSFIIVVKNMEDEIEGLVRYMLRELETADQEYDLVFADCGSTDLTPLILARLAGDCENMKVLNAGSWARPALEALPFCSGSVVHVLDFVNRIGRHEALGVVGTLLRGL